MLLQVNGHGTTGYEHYSINEIGSRLILHFFFEFEFKTGRELWNELHCVEK